MNVTEAPVKKSIAVKASVEDAFKVFTEGFDTWWPRAHHIGKQPLVKAVIETHAGGRCFGREADGTECDWGRVLSWEPPTRILFTWQINGHWQFDPDPAHASEIEVRFHADGPAQTTVEVEHRYFERLVDGENVHGAIRSGGGWPALLDSYARMVKDQSSTG